MITLKDRRTCLKTTREPRNPESLSLSAYNITLNLLFATGDVAEQTFPRSSNHG